MVGVQYRLKYVEIGGGVSHVNTIHASELDTSCNVNQFHRQGCRVEDIVWMRGPWETPPWLLIFTDEGPRPDPSNKNTPIEEIISYKIHSGSAQVSLGVHINFWDMNPNPLDFGPVSWLDLDDRGTVSNLQGFSGCNFAALAVHVQMCAQQDLAVQVGAKGLRNCEILRTILGSQHSPTFMWQGPFFLGRVAYSLLRWQA